MVMWKTRQSFHRIPIILDCPQNNSVCQFLVCVHHSTALTASIKDCCVLFFSDRAFMIRSSMVSFVMMCCTTTVLEFCPYRHNRALVCWYSSSDQVRPNQTMVLPPLWRFKPCPADAGWIRATGISPLFHLAMLSDVEIRS